MFGMSNKVEGSGVTIESAGDALARVQRAVTWRDVSGYDDRWATLVKQYAGQHVYPELAMYEDVVAPNMMFSTVNVIAPSVSVNYPKIAVTARKEEHAMNAATVEAASNYMWQTGDTHEEFRQAVKDFVITGLGWCKTTWLYEEKQVDWDEQSYMDEVQSRVMDLQSKMDEAAAQGADVSGYPSIEDVVGSIPKMRTVVKSDRANVERISGFDIYVDPDATRIKSARWIAQRMYIPIAVAKAREDWDVSARKLLKPYAMSYAKKDIDILYESESRGEEVDFAIVWEYYDLIKEEVSVFAEGCDKYLLKPSPVPFSFAHPFVPLENYKVPDKLYPIGDIEQLSTLQMELSITRTQMVNDRKRYRRMYMYRPDAIGDEGVEALESGDDNALIAVDSDRPFGDVIAPMGTTPLPPEFYNQTSMMLEDINLVSGVSEYARGAVSEIRRTATEANMIQDGANARSADKMAIIERSIGEIADRIVKLSQQYLTQVQVARIVGANDANQWIQYTKEDLYGEYDFQVEAGSTMPQNESSRRQSAMQLTDAMAPFMQMGIVNPVAMAEHMLKMGFGIKDTSKFIQQPPMMDPGMGGAPPEQGPPPGPMG